MTRAVGEHSPAYLLRLRSWADRRAEYRRAVDAACAEHRGALDRAWSQIARGEYPGMDKPWAARLSREDWWRRATKDAGRKHRVTAELPGPAPAPGIGEPLHLRETCECGGVGRVPLGPDDVFACGSCGREWWAGLIFSEERA